MYLKIANPFKSLDYLRLSPERVKAIPTIRMIDPWPISPNIIPKRKGNVMIETTAGFASW